MLGNKMAVALNAQINKEMYSAYLYMAMSAYSEERGLSGFANWFMVQYKEEMTHAMKIYHYLQEQGAKINLKAIEEPPSDFQSPLEMFKKTLVHEQFVTKSINELVDLAISENDHATQIFLQWFVTEQVEEEANDQEIIGKLEMIGDNPGALFMMDRELGSRTFTDETQEE
ncbi:ferritin [bacterium]|nr:ferritin [bacterium]RQV98232.1 MAG: ferritin [bacterium]